MKNGNIQFFLQPAFDFEASRRSDILKIDAAEGRRNRRRDLDDLIRILRIETDRNRIDVSELLEQQRFPLP